MTAKKSEKLITKLYITACENALNWEYIAKEYAKQMPDYQRTINAMRGVIVRMKKKGIIDTSIDMYNYKMNKSTKEDRERIHACISAIVYENERFKNKITWVYLLPIVREKYSEFDKYNDNQIRNIYHNHRHHVVKVGRVSTFKDCGSGNDIERRCALRIKQPTTPALFNRINSNNNMVWQ